MYSTCTVFCNLWKGEAVGACLNCWGQGIVHFLFLTLLHGPIFDFNKTGNTFFEEWPLIFGSNFFQLFDFLSGMFSNKLQDLGIWSRCQKLFLVYCGVVLLH